MSKKITYPKCPYCKTEYREGIGQSQQRYNLLQLVKIGGLTETEVECWNCKKQFMVKVHISYYGSKINKK